MLLFDRHLIFPKLLCTGLEADHRWHFAWLHNMPDLLASCSGIGPIDAPSPRPSFERNWSPIQIRPSRVPPLPANGPLRPSTSANEHDKLLPHVMSMSAMN